MTRTGPPHRRSALTGERRRATKPEKSLRDQRVIGAIPFLNASDDPVELTRLAEAMISELPPDTFPPDNSGLVKRLLYARDLCRDMLRIAILGEDYWETPRDFADPQEKVIRMSELEKVRARNKEIETILASRIFVNWRSRHLTIVSNFAVDCVDEPKTPEDYANLLLGSLVRLIVDTFNSDGGKTGAAWVGICPFCRRFFEKKRIDSVYCGKRCVDAVFRTTKKK